MNAPVRKAGASDKFLFDRKGTAAVEFALVLPLLLLLLFGGIEAGRLLNDFHTVSKSVRDATRFLTRTGLTCPGTTPSSGPLSTYIDDSADETTARNLAMTGTPNTPAAAGDYLLGYWTNPASVTITVNCIANGGNYSGVYQADPLIPQITLTATVPFDFLWGTLFSDVATINMTLSHTQVHIGE